MTQTKLPPEDSSVSVKGAPTTDIRYHPIHVDDYMPDVHDGWVAVILTNGLHKSVKFSDGAFDQYTPKVKWWLKEVTLTPTNTEG